MRTRLQAIVKLLPLVLLAVIVSLPVAGRAEETIRVGAIPPPAAIYEHGDSRMRAFPRLLDAMTDNIIYVVMLRYKKERGEDIRIHQVQDPAILPDHGPELEKMIAAVKKGDLAYFNNKLRNKNKIPYVNILCIWIPIDAGLDNSSETNLELHMIMLTEDYDKVAEEPSSYRVFDVLTLNVRNLQDAKQQILHTVGKQIDEFVKNGVLGD